jgi:hypothetical protein
VRRVKIREAGVDRGDLLQTWLVLDSQLVTRHR